MHALKWLPIMFTMAVSVFAADPFVGEWNLNLTKSDFGGGPKAKTGKTTYAADGGGYQYQSETDYGEGNIARLGAPVQFDGTVNDGNLNGRAVTFVTKRIDENSYEVVITDKETGKESQRFRYTVSPANTLTFLWTKAGETVSKLVYDKK